MEKIVLPQPGMAAEQLPSRDTLEDLHHPTGTALWRRSQQQMDMIGHNLQRIYLQFVALGDPQEDLFQTLGHLPSQDKSAILGNPNEISPFLPPASWGVSSGGFL